MRLTQLHTFKKLRLPSSFQKAFDRFESFPSHGAFDYPNITFFNVVLEKLFRVIGFAYDF